MYLLFKLAYLFSSFIAFLYIPSFTHTTVLYQNISLHAEILKFFGRGWKSEAGKKCIGLERLASEAAAVVGR